MHELSVAQNIIDIVKENVTDPDHFKVKKIFLEVGEFSGIISDSLKFCFDAIKLETPFKNAEMKIKNIPFILFCNACNLESTNTMGIRSCEKCGGFDTEIISGTELKILEVEID